MPQYNLGIIYAITTGICWALLAIALKYALHFSSSGTIVWVRLMVAFFTMLFYFALKKREQMKIVFNKPPLLMIAAGLLLATNYYGYMHGLELTGANNAQIMIQIGPLALLLIGVFYFKERLILPQWIGILIAILGFVFFNWDQILVAFENQEKYIQGNLWILLGALVWAGFASLQKIQLQRGWTPQMTNLLIYGVCAIALYPLANVEELKPLSLWQWVVMISLGVNTLIAYGAFAEAMLLIPASSVSLIVSVNPLLTILVVGLIEKLGWDFISPEPIHWRGYLGAALVVCGVALAVSLRARKPSAP